MGWIAESIKAALHDCTIPGRNCCSRCCLMDWRRLVVRALRREPGRPVIWWSLRARVESRQRNSFHHCCFAPALSTPGGDVPKFTACLQELSGSWLVAWLLGPQSLM